MADELKRDTLTVYPYMEFIPEVVPFFSGKRSQTDDEKSGESPTTDNARFFDNSVITSAEFFFLFFR